MQFHAAFLLAALPLLALANPVAVPEAEAVAVAAPITAAEPLPSLLDKRDKWCKVTRTNVNCRTGAGTGYPVVRKIQPSDNFGVHCKAYGEWIIDTKVWHLVPGWGCWVTAHYTNHLCGGGVPWCPT